MSPTGSPFLHRQSITRMQLYCLHHNIAWFLNYAGWSFACMLLLCLGEDPTTFSPQYGLAFFF